MLFRSQPALNNTAIRSYVSSVLEASNEMVEQIDETLSKKESLNISQLMTNVTINVLSKTLFSTSLGFSKPLRDDIAVIMHWIGQRRLRYPFVVPENWPTLSNKRFHSALRHMDEMIYNIIEEKKKESTLSDDLLSKFISTGEESNSNLNPKELRDEVMTVFLAGHETSTNVLNWAFYLLATHEKIQSKVYDEMFQIGKGELVYEDLLKLPYTSQVLNETMRLYPPVWHFGRVNLENDEIGGYHIPAGSSVRISPYTIQRNSQFWEDPSVFNPDRFEASKEIQPFTFIPFGAGPRLCAGRNFAMMEMLFILTKLLRKFQLTFEGNPIEISPLITLRSKGDIHLICKPRK